MSHLLRYLAPPCCHSTLVIMEASSRLEERVRELEARVRRKQATIDSLRGMVRGMSTGGGGGGEGEAGAGEAGGADLADELEKSRSEAGFLKEELVRAKNKVTELRALLGPMGMSALMDEAAEAERSASKSSKALADLEARAEEQKETIVALRGEVETLGAQLALAHADDAQVAAAGKRAALAASDLSDARADNATLRAALDAAEAELAV